MIHLWMRSDMHPNFLSVMVSVGLLYVSRKLTSWACRIVPGLEGTGGQDLRFKTTTLWWFLPDQWAVVLVDETQPLYILDLFRTRYLTVATHRIGKNRLGAVVLRSDCETLHAMAGRREDGKMKYQHRPDVPEPLNWN